MTKPFIFALLLVVPQLGNAQTETTIPQRHILAMACLENMDVSTTWEQCVGHIFAPCADAELGGEAHVACLQNEREEWGGTMKTLQDGVTEAINPAGVNDLAEILGGWSAYVSQKCAAIGEGKEGNTQKSAELGCQVTELVGLSGEFAACLEGRSTGEYCQLEIKE